MVHCQAIHTKHFDPAPALELWAMFHIYDSVGGQSGELSLFCHSASMGSFYLWNLKNSLVPFSFLLPTQSAQIQNHLVYLTQISSLTGGSSPRPWVEVFPHMLFQSH